jgi:hypothetical protein
MIIPGQFGFNHLYVDASETWYEATMEGLL